MSLDYQLILASQDDLLRRDELRALMACHQELDWRHFRKLKLSVLARQAKLKHKGRASRAMNRLIARGYIEAGGLEDGIKTYRLTLPAPKVAPGVTPQAA